MNKNENNKSMEALADEALEDVAGGSSRFDALLVGGACADCPRIDESVHKYEVIFDGYSMSIYLCPTCVARRRQEGQVVL